MLLALRGGCCVGLGSNPAVNADGFAAGYFGSLACEKSALFSPMFYSLAFIFSSVYSLGFGFLAGLRLGVLRQFQAFLASSACAVRATSYHFSSSAPPPWRSAFLQFAPVVKLGFPFWRLGLTVQSSRPAFGGRLTFVR